MFSRRRHGYEHSDEVDGEDEVDSWQESDDSQTDPEDAEPDTEDDLGDEETDIPLHPGAPSASGSTSITGSSAATSSMASGPPSVFSSLPLPNTASHSTSNAASTSTSTPHAIPTPTLDLTQDSQLSLSPPTKAQRALPTPDPKGKRRASPSATPAPRIPLSHLSCPICLGPPTPLAVTSCGHTFCAGCLHAALLAGPPLSPQDGGPGSGGAGLFGPGASVWGGAAEAMARQQAAEGPKTELDKHCPVCRTVLKGGWGRGLRGLVMRMGKRKELQDKDGEKGGNDEVVLLTDEEKDEKGKGTANGVDNGKGKGKKRQRMEDTVDSDEVYWK